MYLKALEIQGFKSFPDKTYLSFDSDITAIVGPNGSGKSNISDAIRWVMGEMSTKALRGAKMEDVIFGGTLRRSQLGFAEVSLVLDNTDHAFDLDAPEVMVTRRYFRSGDSEYYINRQSARLKDINELFMDTGLGREGYSNIGQGRIDEILSVRSQDRREIFEEAAGISKFRHRKEETERKLAVTAENLVRIGDKIAELELQLDPLRTQAERAKKFLLYRDELRGLEVTVWLDSLARLAETAEKTQADYQAASLALQREHAQLDALYRGIEQAAEDLRARDTAQEALRAQIAAQEADAQRMAGDVAVARTQIEHNSANIERIRQELAEHDGRTGGLSEQIAQSQARADEIAQNLAALQDELAAALEEDGRLSDAAGARSRSLLEMNAAHAALLAAIADQRGRAVLLTASVQELEARAAALEEQSGEAEHRRGEAEEQLSACRASLQQAREQVQSAQNQIDGYRLRMRSREEKRDQLRTKATQLGIEADTVASRIRMFEEMARAYEGYSKAVRVVMQEASRGALRGVHGPVSELLRASDRDALAIETALGAAAQHIIVGSDADARAAIGLLKRRDAGRATFLPLSTIRGRRLEERGLEQQRGFVGVAVNLVEFDSQYAQIVQNLLGRIVVTEDLESASAIAKQYGYRFRVVTRDGQVVNPGGSMTGGSAARSAGILSRANELERLNARAQQLADERASAETALQEAERQAAEVEYEITEAEGRKRLCEDEVLRLEGQEGQFQLLVDAAQNAIDGAAQELASLRGRADEARKSAQTADEQLREQSERADALADQTQQLQQQLDEAQAQSAAVSETIGRIRMQTAALEAERQTALGAMEQLRALEAAMRGDRQQKQSLIERFTAENESLAQQIASLEQQIASLEQQTSQLRQTYQADAQASADAESRKTALEKQTQDQNRELLTMERECARLEQKKSATEMEEKQIIDRLWDTYELTRTTAQTVRQPIESTAAANRRISELKRKISALGTPNLGAIEEFERINERYTYLSGQRDDVTAAKRGLESIIRDIVSEMTEIFRTEFDRINTAFAQTFTELFGGGAARLELEDESDILNCGIEIKAQPPGKQLKSITLLSGGEKALVAIALYFAILKVRPTPFCMLDEIDAALDDRNVAMYASYLRSLCDKTQFIVITHRRGTIEAADVLYGVTMQEQGVSKILTIDLNRMASQLGIQEEGETA